MTDKKSDAEERAVAELLQTPVGRRWLLKAGLSAAMISAVPAWAAATTGSTDPLLAGVCRGRTTACQRRLMQFALGASAKLKDLRVVVNGEEFELMRHTAVSRHELKSRGTLWGKLDRRVLTHYAAVPVPRERPLLLSVHGTRNGKTVVVAQAFHVPEQATKVLARAARKLQGHYGLVAGSPQRLASLGLDAGRLTSAQEIVDLTRILDPDSTARTFVKFHPNVATKDPTALAATDSLLSQTQEVGAFGSYIDTMQQNGEDFATLEPVVDADGQPAQVQLGDQKTPFTTFRLNKTDPGLGGVVRSAMMAGVRAVRDTGSLGAVLDKPLDASPPSAATWHQAVGTAPAPRPYVPSTAAAGEIDVHVENVDLLNGTYIQVNGTLSGRSLPLKLYNNYVRWVWVYVQYLGVDGTTNLSLNESASWPDTRYAQSVGLLPQVFTVFGAPLWDTNTIDVVLDFPEKAASARLLFCGLGNSAQGDWHAYFPPDAYPDSLAPEGEAGVAAILTGIMTLGLNAFALVTDASIDAYWIALRNAVDMPALKVILPAMAPFIRAFTPAEAFASLVATGGATYEDVTANKADLSNLWSILLPLGSVIPKIFFSPAITNPLFKAINAALIEQSLEKIAVSSLALVGAIFEALEVLGDVASLAQAVGETVSSPWVIKNQINLTYPVTVTVSRDPRAATWPVTATSWRLEATIDGATVPALAKTGSINEGGRTQSDPLVVIDSVPYGGNTIQWSFVVLDANGQQVGTGAQQYANNDVKGPPSTVGFAITELPAAISAATVFRRRDTTLYSESAGGYTWSNTVLDAGTPASAGGLEVLGVTIATRLGVAGIVWKAADKYYLRGVPVAENGNTITLGGATSQGFSRRPFLLFDALVGDGDVANHVLLEPDDTADGYYVRRLTIDVATAGLSWDPTASLGYFTLPVSAATLHASGKVVAIHTESGRLGHVLPAGTARPPVAAYAAGPGTEIGLLSSPTAVAVTRLGVVLVLEAGASQLAAFDLNGNPVRYFGTESPAAFTLDLPTMATYLDVAVDGSGQIYLLHYPDTGGEPQPEDYRIDVYTPDGQPLVTNSPGTNVPRLAVDYWRSIYAANYTPLLDAATGQPRIDPIIGVPEPSLSRFDPS